MRLIEELYKERLRISKECQDNWDYGIEQIYKEIIEDHFKYDVDTAISFINSWSREIIFGSFPSISNTSLQLYLVINY